MLTRNDTRHACKHAARFAAGALIGSVSFIALMLAFIREIVRRPAIGEALSLTLGEILPQTMEDLLRRSPSLVRPVPWLSLGSVLIGAYVLFKALEAAISGKDADQ